MDVTHFHNSSALFVSIIIITIVVYLFISQTLYSMTKADIMRYHLATTAELQTAATTTDVEESPGETMQLQLS